MGFLTNHPHSAVTDIIDDCCTEAKASVEDTYLETKLGSLLDAIKGQKDYIEPGPVEGARAIRKKLKYGNLKEQFNALRLLDLLVINGGPKLEPLYNDIKLNDRLQVILVNDKREVHPRITKYAFIIMENWDREFKDDPELEGLLLLYHRCLKNQRMKRNKQSNVPDFMNDEADMDQTYEMDFVNNDDDRPRTNAELDRKYKIPKINYQKEKPKILDLIARSNVLSTNLFNELSALGPNELSIHSVKSNEAFDKCRSTRRIVLRYLQLVNNEELLGPLLKCNDELVTALKKYEELSRSPNAQDIDSDYDSLADLESDYSFSNNAGMNIEDSDDDDDDYYVKRKDRFAPASQEEEEEEDVSVLENRRPPPVPPKKTILREQKVDSQSYRRPVGKPTSRQNDSFPQKSANKNSEFRRQRAQEDDYNPFSDDNEVAPSSWA